MTTDGWRKKAAAHGTPLINALALWPDGGRKFVEAFAAPGVRKDAAWIAEKHVSLANRWDPPCQASIRLASQQSAVGQSECRTAVDVLVLAPCRLAGLQGLQGT